MKTFYIIVATAIVSIAIGTAIGNTLAVPTPNELDKANEEYYNKCEALLDSICAWDDSFMDTVGETDAYFEYCEAREKLNNLK